MKIIPLTRGQYAIVDDEDYEELAKHKWRANYSKGNQCFYAERSLKREGKIRRTDTMHRVIMKANPGEEVDHQNHNTLDNRKENLRITTHQTNQKNIRMRKDNSSGFCGVCWCNSTKKWLAYINVNGKCKHLGRFLDKSMAIASRKAANMEYGFHENHGKQY